MRRLSRMRGPRTLTADELPDLVTFADINDPKSVLWVDPHDLPASLGRDVEWKSITIEVTHEPVTTGIMKKLSWLKHLVTTLNARGCGRSRTSQMQVTSSPLISQKG
ncbi:MAG: hypothetical protein IT537_30150 [Hyphomicrobiales bacterium]|nr:hypothetical protein [Hyphomicrobiales bacterium]